MNKIHISVCFSKESEETFSALWFAAMPRVGDGVETKRGYYRVVELIHETHEALDVEPNIKVVLEPLHYVDDDSQEDQP